MEALNRIGTTAYYLVRLQAGQGKRTDRLANRMVEAHRAAVARSEGSGSGLHLYRVSASFREVDYDRLLLPGARLVALQKAISGISPELGQDSKYDRWDLSTEREWEVQTPLATEDEVRACLAEAAAAQGDTLFVRRA